MTNLSTQINSHNRDDYIQTEAELEEKYTCPIGLSIMKNPMKAPCGHIFENQKILNWLAHNQTCPIDRKRITQTMLVLDKELQKEIKEYLVQNPEKDDSQIDIRIIELDESSRQSFFSSLKNKLSQAQWKESLRNTHRFALKFFILSTSAFTLITFIHHHQEVASLNLQFIKKSAFYFMCSSGGLMIATSESLLNYCSGNQTRRNE